jgi:hypothetical protein
MASPADRPKALVVEDDASASELVTPSGSPSTRYVADWAWPGNPAAAGTLKASCT